MNAKIARLLLREQLRAASPENLQALTRAARVMPGAVADPIVPESRHD